MIGEAILYGDFPDTGAGSKEIDDLAGRKRDVRLHGMFRFEFVQEKGAKQDGMKMRRLQVFCDTSPMIAEMRKRGMMNSDDHL